MSGGRWDYLSKKMAERVKSSGEVWRLLAALEQELDWGLSGDLCAGCAKVRTAEAIIAFFEDRCNDATKAVALAKAIHRKYARMLPALWLERAVDAARKTLDEPSKHAVIVSITGATLTNVDDDHWCAEGGRVVFRRPSWMATSIPGVELYDAAGIQVYPPDDEGSDS